MKNTVATILFLVWWGAMLGLACHPEILNPDPIHGGECRDGDQLGERCSDGVTCCHPSAGERCGLQPRQCVTVDPGPQWLGAKLDAGADAR